MIYTKKIRSAIRFAIKTHEIYQKQKRKGKDVAYISHPLTVGIILASTGAKEDVVVAGILHDTIEDSIKGKKVSEKMLIERFGGEVAALVASVTEKDKELSWDQRKQSAISSIPHLSHESLLLKSADVVSNVSELIDDFARKGDSIFSDFNAPKDKILDHHIKAIGVIVSCWEKNPLKSDLISLAGDLKKIKLLKLTENSLYDKKCSQHITN